MTANEAKVVEAWKIASAELGFEFTAPYKIPTSEGLKDVLGFVHKFGRRVGAVISVLDEPSEKIKLRLTDDEYFYSILGTVYQKYERGLWIDTLNDWQFFGSADSRPDWYTGASW